MDLSEFDYDLPLELIAQHPLPQRDASRLLWVDRSCGSIEESKVGCLDAILKQGDLLVLNETYVHPARLFAAKDGTGARIELLLLSRRTAHRWEAMAQRVSRLREGTRLIVGDGLEAVITSILGDGHVEVEFDYEGEWDHVLASHGHVPLPPYIKRDGFPEESEDRQRYQTVYALRDSSRPSAAAPTAGLHFTEGLLGRLEQAGITIARLQLQVGRDTFLPIRVESVEKHRMHSEWYRLPAETAAAINQTHEAGGRVIAVGTTVVRVLESCANDGGSVSARDGTTDIFIRPGYRFRCVDALMTNFHLPNSTLIVLVAAFCGLELQRRAYREAIERRFRFYSYGDAMLIT